MQAILHGQQSARERPCKHRDVPLASRALVQQRIQLLFGADQVIAEPGALCLSCACLWSTAHVDFEMITLKNCQAAQRTNS